MKKYKNVLDFKNNKLVIDYFLEKPTERINYEDHLKDYMRPLTGETEITASLRALSAAGLLNEERKKKRKSYKISTTKEALRKIFDGYCISDIDVLLNSNYISYYIVKRGFVGLFESIKNRLIDSDFRQTASTTLLNLPATKEEYANFGMKLKTCISETKPFIGDSSKIRRTNILYELHGMHEELTAKRIGLIELLSSLEPREAVRFYRENIHKSVYTGLNELTYKSVITSGLNDFLVLDNYLSPLSSYPVNGTLQLLFAQPFQRIYEDIYLLDGEAFKLMSSRAAAIFNNFADIVFELIKNDPPEEKMLCAMTKQMIFHWNVASTRFDLICDQLVQIYKKNNNCRNYHLGTEGLSYKIADLDDDSKQLLPEYISKSILVHGSAPLVFEESGSSKFIVKPMEDPFTKLRPCLTFKDMNCRNDFIPIKKIMDKLELKLAEFEKGGLT
jgi:hypothetical protein